MPSRRRVFLYSFVLLLSATACGGDTVSTTDLGTASGSEPAAVSDNDTVSTTDLGTAGGSEPAAVSDDCLVDEEVAVSGIPSSDNDLRHEDIIELLTGERQTGDLDPVEVTIDAPNFGGVWGDTQGGIVVAVLDCSKVDANELARIAGGPDYLHLIEVPYTFNQMDAFRDALVQDLNELGVEGDVSIDSTLSGRVIEVRVRDLDSLPQSFGSVVPDDVYEVVEGDISREE